MSKTERQTFVKRVFLAFDYSHQGVAARKIAFHLAESLQAELIGLFLEDEEVLQSSRFPFASEIIASSAAERKLDYQDMQRSLRAWSAQIQKQLQEQANREKIKCSFQTVIGRRSESILSHSSDQDVLVFSGSRYRHYTHGQKAHLVYVLVDENSNLSDCLSFLNFLIGNGVDHVVFIKGPGESATDRIAEFMDSLTQAKHLQVIRISENLPTALAGVTRQLPAELVIVPGGHSVAGQLESLKALQNALQCPVVVFPHSHS